MVPATRATGATAKFQALASLVKEIAFTKATGPIIEPMGKVLYRELAWDDTRVHG